MAWSVTCVFALILLQLASFYDFGFIFLGVVVEILNCNCDYVIYAPLDIIACVRCSSELFLQNSSPQTKT
jgi:hypothetical protein